MKTKLCILLAFFVSTVTFSQIDSIQKPGIVHYKMKYPSSGGKDFQQINAELHFNATESLFVYNKVGLDSIRHGSGMQMGKKDGKITGVSVYISSLDEIGHLIYRDFDSKKIILRYTKTSYIVQDNWLPIKWTIMDEYKEILGHKAKKAIAQFRGRIYIAWFTKEIPVPYGPWKFFGLPGLILEAYDTFNVANFKVEEICYPCNDGQVDKPSGNEIKNMKEVVYMHDYSRERIWIKLNKSAMNVVKKDSWGFFSSGQPPTNLEYIQEQREQSFEKQYEWEGYPGDTPSPYEKTLVEQAHEIWKKASKDAPKKLKDSLLTVYENRIRTRTKTHSSLETVPKSIPIEAGGN